MVIISNYVIYCQGVRGTYAVQNAYAENTGRETMMTSSKSPFVVRRIPYWENPPELGQDLRELEWGVLEVLSDNSVQFIKTQPDPIALKKLIEQIESASGKSHN